ncbi:Golgi apparatus protein 1 [Schistocerca serialis cubense]|uniref:Golgi apparatus protein 1 n=1 Tax=Schistocerca serialis cubense TaxID=2023355 RepID=UPI00214E0870|nr:Golgi apparatus protein 1 [Schistocerca serialis cubense]
MGWRDISVLILHVQFQIFCALHGGGIQANEIITFGKSLNRLEPNKVSAGSDAVNAIRNKRSPVVIPLLHDEHCKLDLQRWCGNLPNNDDLTVLECIQSFKGSELAELTKECQNKIWERTLHMISDQNMTQLAKDYCSSQLIQSLGCQPSSSVVGNILACMIDKREKIEEDKCHTFVQRMEWIAFSDFRMMPAFYKECSGDVKTFQCGRLHTNEAFRQGKTLACLQKYIRKLSAGCHRQVLHLSEIQADDIKLDRQLFLACANDHQRFCPNMPRGSGRVYKCLMEHKLDKTMSKECQDQLMRRQKLISEDFKVSRGLARTCKDDIRLFHCRRSVSDDKEIRLVQILLCLEGVIRNGTKVTPECQSEMIEHRKILMEDYRLSPEIVLSCPDDISKYCKGLEVGGRTIHCLMEHARQKRKEERISPACQRALEVLVKEADAGEDWRVDPVLREACKPVVDSACKEVRGGDARVLSCLMEKLGTDHMNEACETALLQIQYFVARDFKLDPQLFRNCREDAARLCHAKRFWIDADGQMDPERGPLVLPCLYRYAYHTQETLKLKSECLAEIRRVMRQRAVSVDLLPEVEEVCMEDIAIHCYEKTGKGEEMVCLQDNLERLDPKCKTAVANFTEEQAEHIELNPIILSVCQKVMEKHCEAELETGKDEGDVMDCLIAHKNEPDVRSNYKCRAAVEHFQLISLKDYHFTYKFKEACRQSVIRYCPAIKTKADVIRCLSEIVRNDTLRNVKQNIPKDCRQQLRAQLFQQRENIDFDPRIKKNCYKDVQQFCKGIPKGAAQTLECLQINKDKLSDGCHMVIFNVERQELQDSSVDYALITTCRHMINQFCHGEDPSQALICLKRYKDDPTFDSKCKSIVVRRMIEQSSDYRFNPLLQKSCRMDISKFCADIVASEKEEKELNGKVVKCLKVKFREQKLSQDCESEMTNILREAALNYRLNPLLATMCRKEIEDMCPPDENADGGAVEECLKNAFNKHRISNRECQIEVAGLIEEAKADIHVDPLLHKACGVDVSKFCSDIPQGNGRHVQCLQEVLQDPTKTLKPDCQEMLTKRIEMFRNAALVVAPETIEELYATVSRSPSKTYFMIVALTMIGVIFIMGLSCGRLTRRTLLMKNK